MKDFSLVKQVSRQNLERDVKFLSTNWPTRHTLSRHHDAIAAYLEGRLAPSVGRARIQTYQMGGRTLKNVVGVAEHTGDRSLAPVLFCAHFDSRQERLDLPEAPAPGADDNATGVAAILEIARLWKLHGGTKNSPVIFALFSGEEQNFWGSSAYVHEFASENARLRFVFNLDEIGYPPQKGPKSLYVDRDERGRKDNDAESSRLVNRCCELARTVVNVPTKIDPAEASDYMPFEKIGVPVLGLYEGEYRYPHYHKSTDTADRVDFGYVADMTRLSLAFLIDQCG